MAIPKSGDRPENNMNIQQNPETGKYRIEGRTDLGEADTAEELQSRLQKQPNTSQKPSQQSSPQKPATGKQQPTKATPPPPPVPSEQGQSPERPFNTGNHQRKHPEDSYRESALQEGTPQEAIQDDSDAQIPSDEQPQPEAEPVTTSQEDGENSGRQKAQESPTTTPPDESENGERDAKNSGTSNDDVQKTPESALPIGTQPQRDEQDSPQKPENSSTLQNPQQGASPGPQKKNDAQGSNQKPQSNDSGDLKGKTQNIKDSNAMRTTPKSPMGSLKDTAKEKAKETATNAAKDTKAGQAAEKAVDVADKTKKTFGAIKAGAVKVKAMIPIITNPYFWLVVLIMLGLLGGMLFIMASPQVIGRDDNRRVCLDENSINNQIGTMSAADARGRAQEIGDYLTNTHFEPLGGPMTVTQAAAFVGNLMVETGGTLDPSIKQGGDTSDMSNSEVRAWSGGRGGRALGIVQWDVGRALQLIDFAESRDAKWNDLEIQIEFFTHELNGSEGGGVRNALPQLESSDIETVTLAWDRAFWRSAGYHGQERVGHAVEFMEYYEQGAHAGTHGVTICNDHDLVSMDASSIVDLAISIAHTSGRIEDSHVPSFGFDIYGDAVAPEAYKEANALAFENGGADPYAGGRPVYASCDRFVATVLKASKTDVDVPWGSTGIQLDHYRASDKWEHVTSVTTGEDPVAKGAEAGDVLIRVGHTALYLGTPENATEIGLSPGEPAVADASIMRRVGFVRPFVYMDSPSQRYEVFRCVKDCGEDTLEDVT